MCQSTRLITSLKQNQCKVITTVDKLKHRQKIIKLIQVWHASITTSKISLFVTEIVLFIAFMQSLLFLLKVNIPWVELLTY